MQFKYKDIVITNPNFKRLIVVGIIAGEKFTVNVMEDNFGYYFVLNDSKYYLNWFKMV